MTITLFVSAAVGLGLWLNNSGGTQPAAGRAAMPGGQAARVQASNPGGVQAPAPLPETIAGAGKAAQPPTVTAATAAPVAVPIGITSPADFQPVAPAVVQAPQAPPAPSDVQGVRTVELSAAELARLGVRVDSVGVWMTWMQAGNNEPFLWAVSPKGIVTTPDGTRLEGVEVPSISPVLITDDQGMKRAILFEPSAEETALQAELASALKAGAPESVITDITNRMNEQHKRREQALDGDVKAGRLVAILVRNPFAKQNNPKGWRPDCILWYTMSAELLARLPGAVRQTLEQEAAVADLPAGDRVVGERPMLDELRATSGAVIYSSVIPTPATDYAVIAFRLREARSVSVSLHDVNGRHVRQLAEPASRNAGEHRIETKLNDLHDGVYLVVFTTDRGERAVQRMIVAH